MSTTEHPHRHRNRAAGFLATLIGLTLCLLAAEARAQVFDFTPLGASNSFETATNWIPNGPPGPGDTARFNSNTFGAYEVIFSSSPTIGILEVTEGAVTFRPLSSSLGQNTLTLSDTSIISGGILTLAGRGNRTLLLDSTATNDGIVVGDARSGALLILDGGTAQFVGDVDIATVQGSSGQVTVNGTSASLVLPDRFLRVGNNGNGTLLIQNGASVLSSLGRIGNNPGSTGIATVDGLGATWTNTGNLLVGAFGGNGTLLVQNQGSVSNSRGSIAHDEESTGHATVDDATWVVDGRLIVADQGNGTLLVRNGGSVTNSFSSIAEEVGSMGQAFVRGAGSTWNNSDELLVGEEGNGALAIEDGGSAFNTVGSIGMDLGSIGNVTIDGLGSSWTNNSNLRVGVAGNGTMQILNDGSVSNVGGFIADEATSVGQVTVDGIGSTWTNSSELRVGNAGNGALTIKDGGVVTNTIGFVAFHAESTGDAIVRGSGSRWSNRNSLFVGNSGTGTLLIEAGGVIENTSGVVGTNSGVKGTAIIRDAGSIWSSSGDLITGLNGDATLTIQDGGRAANVNGIIASRSGSTGQVIVGGAGSTWSNLAGLFVGGSSSGAGGIGSLSIETGGTVSAGNVTRIYNNGQVNLFGGTLTTATLEDQGGEFNWQAGTLSVTGSQGVNIGSTPFVDPVLIMSTDQMLSVTNKLTIESSSVLSNPGGNVTANHIEIEADGTWTVLGGIQDVGTGLANNGTAVFINTTVAGPVNSPAGSVMNIVGDVTFNGLVSGAGGFFGSGTAIFNGGHNPGDSPAVVTVEGNVFYGDANTLTIELGGFDQGESDILYIEGDATLDGTLAVELLGGFTPSMGD